MNLKASSGRCGHLSVPENANLMDLQGNFVVAHQIENDWLDFYACVEEPTETKASAKEYQDYVTYFI